MAKFDFAFSKRRGELNWFLARLPSREYDGFAARLDDVDVEAGRVLYEPGHTMSAVYFPADAIISVVCCPSLERSLEVAVVAHDGFVGPDLLRRPPTAISRFLVQSGGRLRRASHQSLRRLLERSPTARQLAARCREALFEQVILCAACNVGHSPRERCARWFLMIHDRTPGDEFLVKQEFLGYMLGMTRQTVSGVASQLQELGSIEYSRGRIRVTDRERLERLACPCYGAIRSRLHELLS